MNDDDRAALSTREGDRMLGPKERYRCEEHPRRWVIYRWTWAVGEGPEQGDPEVVRACQHPDHDD